MDIIIALDQGSSSSRALALDCEGRVVARAQFPIKTFYPHPGFVEHDALDLAHTQERALDVVLGKLPRKANVLGVGLASQRSTIVFWDRRTGAPACRVPSWQDGRAADVMAGLESHQAAVREKTGLYLTPYYSAPKISHLLEHEPKLRGLAEENRLLIGPVGTYLIWRWTKGEVFSVDPSLAQRMLLFNIRENTWDDHLLSLFRVPRRCLPDILPTTGLWGILVRKRRRMPILSLLGDQQAAALGQGATKPGTSVLNYGTGAFFMLNTGTELKPIPGLLNSVAWQRRDQPCVYFQEGTVHAAGTSLEWLKRNFGLLRDLRTVDALCQRSTHRILALQAIGGLGAPRWDYRTATAYLGLSAHSKSEDLVRAVVEGIAFLTADIFASIVESGFKIDSLYASGGLARIDYLLRFQANILQRSIIRFKESEATALGAASLALEEAKVSWAEALHRGTSSVEFKPEMEPETAARLLQGWKLFVSGVQKLSQDLRQLGVLE